MNRAAAPLERRLWTAAGAYLAAIYSSLYFLPFALDFLRSRNLLRWTLAAIFLALALAVAGWAISHRTGPHEWAVLLAAGAVYALLLGRMEILQERLHIPEYGLLGLLICAALEQRWGGGAGGPSWRAAGAAVLLAGLAGWGDEGIQALLPNRVYDLRDVAFNTAAVAGAIATWVALEAARVRDRRARR